ncbi:unnamed protein product [Rotaria magnacalcarata]|nr:unnamed protein product [Rotaria magnacalcarata]CAF3982900.1 unnamed protein product [Rotaria magnacalcarata]
MEAFRSDAQQKLTRLRLIASRLNKEIAMKPDSSRAELHQCISQCTMSLDFLSPLILPSNCSQHILSKLCHVTIAITYDFEHLHITFFMSDSESDFDNGTLTSIAQQIVSIRYHDQFSLIYLMHFICYTGDNCNWNYARQVINRFKTVNYQPLYNSLDVLLYDNMGNFVSQCYESNTHVANTGSSFA